MALTKPSFTLQLLRSGGAPFSDPSDPRWTPAGRDPGGSAGSEKEEDERTPEEVGGPALRPARRAGRPCHDASMTTAASLLDSPLGVCILPAPAANAPRPVRYADYLHEILGHAGLCYQRLDREALAANLDQLAILVTVGEVAFPDDLRARLPEWVAAGGAWLSIGGL